MKNFLFFTLFILSGCSHYQVSNVSGNPEDDAVIWSSGKVTFRTVNSEDVYRNGFQGVIDIPKGQTTVSLSCHAENDLKNYTISFDAKSGKDYFFNGYNPTHTEEVTRDATFISCNTRTNECYRPQRTSLETYKLPCLIKVYTHEGSNKEYIDIKQTYYSND